MTTQQLVLSRVSSDSPDPRRYTNLLPFSFCLFEEIGECDLEDINIVILTLVISYIYSETQAQNYSAFPCK